MRVRPPLLDHLRVTGRRTLDAMAHSSNASNPYEIIEKGGKQPPNPPPPPTSQSAPPEPPPPPRVPNSEAGQTRDGN